MFQLGGLVSLVSKLLGTKLCLFRLASKILNNKETMWYNFLFSAQIAQLFIAEFSCASRYLKANQVSNDTEDCYSLWRTIIKGFTVVFLISHLTGVILSLFFVKRSAVVVAPCGNRRNYSIEIIYVSGVVFLEFIRTVGGEYLLVAYALLTLLLFSILYYISSDLYYIPCRFERIVFRLTFAISIWISIYLVVSIGLQDYTPDYLLETIFLTSPLILFLTTIRYNQEGFRIIQTRISNTSSPQECEVFLDYLQLLYISNDTNSKSELFGYIRIHQLYCSREFCSIRPNKIYKDVIKGDLSLSLKLLHDAIPELISNMYMDAIKMYPNSYGLRVSYSMFLSKIMNSNVMSLNVLKAVENLTENFSSVFLISSAVYEIEHWIEINKINELGDFTEAIKENTLSYKLSGRLDYFIITVTKYFWELWRTLQGEGASISRMISIVECIYSNTSQITSLVDTNLKRVEKNPYIIRKYALYLLFVKNDENEAMELLEKSRSTLIVMTKREFAINNMNLDQDFGRDQYPILIVQIINNELRIHDLNLAFCALSRKKREELLNYSFLNLVPPSLSAYYHENIGKELLFVKNHGQQITIVLKKSNGSIKKCSAETKIVTAYGNKRFVIMKFDSPYYELQQTTILLNKEGEILEVDERFEMFFISQNGQDSKLRRLSIDFEVCLTNLSKVKEYSIIREMILNMADSNTNDCSERIEIPTLSIYIKICIERLNLESNNQFIVMIHQIETLTLESCIQAHSEFQERKKIGSEFMFFYDVNSKKMRGSFFIGGLGINLQQLAKLHIRMRHSRTDNLPDEDILIAQSQVIDFKKGISSHRLLCSGKIVPIQEDEAKIDILEEEFNNNAKESIFKKEDHLLKDKRSRKGLAKEEIDPQRSQATHSTRKLTSLRKAIAYINNKPYHKRILYILFGFLTISSIYSYLQYTAFNGMIERSSVYVKIGRSTIQLYFYLCNLHSPVVDILLYNSKSPVNQLSYEEYQEVMKDRIKHALADVTKEREYLNTLLITSGDNDWAVNATSLELRLWRCHVSPNNIVMTSLFECLLKLESATINLIDKEMSEFSMRDSDVFIVVMNTVNDIQNQIIRAYYIWPEYMSLHVYNNVVLTNLPILDYLNIGFSIFFMMLLYYFFNLYLKQHQEILNHFFGYRNLDCKLLESRCDYYISNISEEDIQDIDDIGIDEYNQLNYNQSTKKDGDDIILKSTGSFKGSTTSAYFGKLLLMALSLLVFPFYTHGSYYISTKLIDSYYNNLDFMRMMDVLDLASISMREKLKSALFNPEGIFWEKSSYDTWIEFRDSGRKSTIKVFKLLFQNQDSTSDLKATYNTIFNGDTCKFFNEKRSKYWVNNVGDCQSLFNSTLPVGFSYTYSSILNMMERYLDDVEYFIKSENPIWPYEDDCPDTSTNKSLSLLRCITKQKDYQELEIVVGSYQWVILSEFFEIFKSYRESEFRVISGILLSSLLIYLVVFLIFMGLVWIYAIMSWNSKLRTHRAVLGMVNLDILMRNSRLMNEIYRAKMKSPYLE